MPHRSSSRDQPPQLPPRDNIYGVTTAVGPPLNNVWGGGSGDKGRDKKKGGDDPYYFGLSAR